MAKFVTIGYGDQASYERTVPEAVEAAHGQDAELTRRGALIGIALGPVQVRNPDGTGVLTQEGPFMSSPLPIGGFAIIEATDMAEAIELVSKSPCAVAHGVVEIRPLDRA